MDIPYHLLFQAIIEQTGEGIALANQEGSYVLVNPIFCQMTGYSQDELLTMHIGDLLPSGTKIEIFPQVLNRQKASRILELKRKDGTHFLAEVKGYPITLENQNLILGIVQDITERTRQEIAFQESEGRALAYLEQTEQLHQVVDQLNRAQSLEEVYTIAVAGIVAILKADRSSLLLFGDDNRVHFKAWRHLSDAYRQKVDGHCPWQSHETNAVPIFYNALPSAELDEALNETLQAEGLGALLFVPLNQPDRLLGKFMVYFNQPHQWTDQELRLSQVIAQNLSAIIGRLQALEEMQRATEELRHMVKALKRGEETIAELAEYNQNIVASAPIGIVTVNAEGKITSANDAFIKMVGSPSAKETLKLNIDIPALRAVGFDKALQAVLSAGEIITINQLEYTSHWGKTITVNFKVVPQKQQDGRITGAIIVIDDVTTDTQAEKLQTAVYRIAQAADQAKTLDELFRNIHNIVQTVMFADNFYIALYNKTDDAIAFPYYVDEVTPQTSFKFRHSRRGMTEYILNQAKSQLVTAKQFETLIQTGEVELFGQIPAVYLGVPLLLGGDPIGVMTVQHYRDHQAFGERERQMLEYVASQVAQTIDRKQKETALRKSEAQYRLLAENFRESLVIYDWELSKTIYANPSTFRIFGIPPTKIIEHGIEDTLSKIIHPEDQTKLLQASQTAAQLRQDGNITALEIEFRIIRADGQVRWLHQYSYPAPADSGPPTLVYMMLSDITERREAEIALQESNQQLQTALAELKEAQENMVQRERLAAVGQLAAGIAHDFNNIMAVIVLYTEMMLRMPHLPEGLHKRLETILREAWRATELVQQILDFSRRAVLEPKPLNLVPFLKEQVKLLERTLPENIRFHLAIDSGGFTVHADPTRLQQIVMNLVVNARDAMPSGGNLWLELNHIIMPKEVLCAACQRPFSGDWIKLTIRDNGSGISDDTLPHIFEPFFTTKPAGLGSGLGLSQVAGIIDQHGGHLRVESQPGRGTSFAIYLPFFSEPEQVEPMPKTAVIPKGNLETLLIVEDDAAIRAALADTIAHLNYRVITAVNGQDALDIIAKNTQPIDLVLSDMVMPIMGGQALFQAIQAQTLNLPIILLSGYPLKGDLQNLQAQGLAGWLLKPPDIGKLAHLVAQVLAQRTPAD
ncbi:MAG: PAS domain S-box protein [Chloroflexota bacterium]